MARVLIAEDDGAVREFVRRALVHGGHEVATANDGLDALDVLGVDENFDLLITDIVMPGLDGIALALKVAKEHPKTAILMMTGYAAERQRAHNLEEL
ncbi:MAG: response regulator, partial [Rhodospirillaceae bacterium]|nr:response regulator [Rhodospirillaceae bacterium]